MCKGQTGDKGVPPTDALHSLRSLGRGDDGAAGTDFWRCRWAARPMSPPDSRAFRWALDTPQNTCTHIGFSDANRTCTAPANTPYPRQRAQGVSYSRPRVFGVSGDGALHTPPGQVVCGTGRMGAWGVWGLTWNATGSTPVGLGSRPWGTAGLACLGSCVARNSRRYVLTSVEGADCLRVRKCLAWALEMPAR